MMNQRTLKLLFLLGHPVNPNSWINQESLLKVLGGGFGQEVSVLDRLGFVSTRVEEIRPNCVDNFFQLTERGKKEAAKIRLRMSK